MDTSKRILEDVGFADYFETQKLQKYPHDCLVTIHSSIFPSPQQHNRYYPPKLLLHKAARPLINVKSQHELWVF